MNEFINVCFAKENVMKKSQLDKFKEIAQKFCDNHIWSKYRYLSKFSVGYVFACVMCLSANYLGFVSCAVLS